MLPVSPKRLQNRGKKTDDPLQMYLADIYTIAVNLAGLPGLSVPSALTRRICPIGLQISPTLHEDKRSYRTDVSSRDRLA